MDRLIDKALCAALRSAKYRCSKIDREFSLTQEQVRWMLEQQRGRCAVSGLVFEMRRFPDAFVKHPFAPSLDRIDSRGGYTPDNVRIVCTAVNFGLGQWGEEVFRSIAEATLRNQPSATELTASSLDERISAAEAILPILSATEQAHQKRRIASLKRARTLGADGLRSAALRAHTTRRQKQSG